MIKLNNINKKYDSHEIFKDFNLEIADGEFCAIYGPSGSGKSTLLNIIGLLEKVDSGSICINNISNPFFLNKKGRKLLKNDISIIFQNFGLLENKTVYQNLLYSFNDNKKKIDKKKIMDDALKKVNIETNLNKMISKFSGGEQQRIAIAKAIIKKSSIILCDEPTGNLDNDNKIKIINLLKTLNKEGKTIIVVTHDLEMKKEFNKLINLECIEGG